ncbi:MAG: DUF6364 family protein, partial [Bacteroidota bacterium]
QVIVRAKTYARKRKTSLSKLIEAYLKHLTTPSDASHEETTPLVKSLSGVTKGFKSSEEKSAYKKHIIKKYSR